LGRDGSIGSSGSLGVQRQSPVSSPPEAGDLLQIILQRYAVEESKTIFCQLTLLVEEKEFEDRTLYNAFSRELISKALRIARVNEESQSKAKEDRRAQPS